MTRRRVRSQVLQSDSSLGLSCSSGRSGELPAPPLVLGKANDWRSRRFRLSFPLTHNANSPCCLLLMSAVASSRSRLSLFPADRELLHWDGGCQALAHS